MKQIKIAVILSILCSPATAEILSVHCPLGCPSNPDGNSLLFGHLYALSNNKDTKFADWVAYEVNVSNFGTSPGRKWSTDPLLKEPQTLEPNDYKSASTSALEADRGHQAPLASFAGSKYWPELNYLSNITPQDKDLNQGPWKNLEEAVRNAVSYRKPLFVITGPLYTSEMPSLPKADESHKVPSGYFKVIYEASGKYSAFVMEQASKRNDQYCQKKTSLDTIQKQIHFHLPKLDADKSIYTRLGC